MATRTLPLTRNLPMISGILVFLGLATPSPAQYVWTGGGGDHLWSTSANWTLYGLPLPDGFYPGGLFTTAKIPGNNEVDLDVSVVMAQVTIKEGSTLHVLAGSYLSDASFAGAGTLDNHGTVIATFRTVDFGTGVVLTDTAGSCRWKASGLLATLKFNRPFTGACALNGDFVVSTGGTLNVQASIETAGNFPGSCLDIITGVGVTFTYNDGFDQCP